MNDVERLMLLVAGVAVIISSGIWLAICAELVRRARLREHKETWAAANRWNSIVRDIGNGNNPHRRI